jgi:AMP-polyphosphate phosphotransferase
MFEKAENGKKLSKEEYKKAELLIRPALIEMQQKLIKRKDFSVLILMSGVEGAGKEEAINFLTEWLDPRGLEVTAFVSPTAEELERPPMYRYWRVLPPKGKTGLFYGSWYSQPIVDRVFDKLGKKEFNASMQDIARLEEHLYDEGVILIKFWMHLSKKAQKDRHKKLSKDPRQCWKISELDKDYFKKYDDFFKVSERALEKTDKQHAAWHVIDAVDDRYREIEVARILLDTVNERLATKKKSSAPKPMAIPRSKPKSKLDKIHLDRALTKDKYEVELEKLQAEIAELTREAYRRGISSVIAYEGWDAGGKGGNIRRLTSGIDARYTRVIPIAAPNQVELMHPYLWRFWLHLPRDGRVTVFDRSWYGRVMVERVEGFCTPNDWQRAYDEINDFERQIIDSGSVLMKYWIHISREEQLRRFNERKKIAYKQFKITDDDWRNRKKWNAYLLALDEMIKRTSTKKAPWTIIPGNNKYFARITAIKAYRDELKKVLKKSKKKDKKSAALKMG